MVVPARSAAPCGVPADMWVPAGQEGTSRRGAGRILTERLCKRNAVRLMCPVRIARHGAIATETRRRIGAERVGVEKMMSGLYHGNILEHRCR